MSNRRRTKKEKRDRFLAKIKGDLGLDLSGRMTGVDVETQEVVELPSLERVVNKTVPAVIHWKDWPQVDRDDDEIIGETVIYEDGTFDMVINRDITLEAQGLVNEIHQVSPFNVSLAKED